METCIYKVDYQHISRCSWAFDNMHAVAYVEAEKGISKGKLEILMHSKFKECHMINCFYPIDIVKLG